MEADREKEAKAGKEDEKGGNVHGGSSGVRALTGAKVAPQQVIAKEQRHKEKKTESKPRETWAFPIIVLSVVEAYAAVPAVFFNHNG